jgi:hypothetical protein
MEVDRDTEREVQIKVQTEVEIEVEYSNIEEYVDDVNQQSEMT